MAIYSIFTRDGDPEPQAVSDRFSWFAALVPPVHALTYGLWWGLLLWVAGLAATVGLSFVIGDEAAFWLYVLFAVFLGFEAHALRRASLRRRGYGYAGERIARDEELAQVAWLHSVP